MNSEKFLKDFSELPQKDRMYYVQMFLNMSNASNVTIKANGRTYKIKPLKCVKV